jgi:hypothetical protein
MPESVFKEHLQRQIKMIKKKLNPKLSQKEDSLLKKDFLRRVLYIGLCMIPIFLFASETGTYRLVPLPFFLVGMWNLLMIIGFSQDIVDAFFPPKVQFEKTTKPFDKFAYYFSSILFFVGLLSLLFEIRNFDNTIHGTRLFWSAGATGIGLAILLTVILKITNPSIYFESKRRYTVHFGLFVGFFLLMAFVAGFTNHHFAENKKICKRYTIERKGTSGSKSKEYFIELLVGQEMEERFSIQKSKFDSFSEGETIELCMVTGKLGFEFVTDFNKLENGIVSTNGK